MKQFRGTHAVSSVLASAALVAVWLSGSALAQETTDCSSLIDKTFEVTGTTQEIAQIPDSVTQFARNSGATLTPDVAQRMKRALAPQILLKALKDSFLQDCDESMLKDVIGGMDTPFGVRMRDVELKEQNPNTAQRRIAFYKDMRLHPPGDKRHDLVIQMDDATESSQVAWDMVTAMTKAVGAVGGSSSVSEADLEAQRQKYQPLLRTAALCDLLFVYRNVSDDDLAQYVALLRTPSYEKFNRTMSRSLVNTFVSQTAKALTEMKRSGQSPKSAPAR